MSKGNNRPKAFRLILIILAAVILAGIISVFAADGIVVLKSKPKIVSAEEAKNFDADCILVLGAGVRGTKPTPMLADRLNCAIELYFSGAAPKIIMSGDHGREDYDEVNVMKDYAIAAGVPSEDIFMDHAGFSTYESMYRARDVFLAQNIIVVTQRYHLYRALYDADSLGLEAHGVSADTVRYSGQTYRDIREIAARAKDFLYCIFKPHPTYLGEAIPVSGNGNLTNDRA